MSKAVRTVTAGVLENNGLFLIAMRKPGGDLSGKWEFPGGKVKPGEDEQSGLARELAEELGLRVRVNAFLCQTEFVHQGSPFLLRAYFVETAAGTPRALEHEEIRWVRLQDLAGYDFADSDKVIVRALLARSDNARLSRD